MKATLTSLINFFPWFRRLIKSFRGHPAFPARVSSNYVVIQNNEVDSESKRLRSAWLALGIPEKQRKLVDKQLKKYRSGAQIDVFDIFVKSLRELPINDPNMSLLEVGCSSGFYSEVLEIAKLSFNYSGCDYSRHFIDLAHKNYPHFKFDVEDATNLSYKDASFDIVVSGCCLLHIPDYPRAILETARVARSYAVFHRTPVVWGQPERWYRKMAYGVETVEIHFNEIEFVSLLDAAGFELLNAYTLDGPNPDVMDIFGSAIRTYVCRKRV